MSHTRAADPKDPPVGARTLATGACEDNVRGVYIAVTGNLQVTMKSGDQVTFNNIAAGIEHPMQLRSVDNLGTCTGLLLW